MDEKPKKHTAKDIIDEYKRIQNRSIEEKTGKKPKEKEENVEKTKEIPKMDSGNIKYESEISKETDTDLMISYETISLPSRGLFYKNGLKEINVEYMTSRDEDLLTTPSLIENETVINKLLKRKIKTPNVIIDDLLPGDKSAIILFLRTSSYGPDYTVEVEDPRTGKMFKEKINLLNLKQKELTEFPDEDGCFSVEIPMRKKTVRFRLLTSGEEENIRKTAERIKEEYNEEYAEYSTLRLKSSIVSINNNTDRNYINKFVDAMPALDSLTIRKKINKVSPEYDMNYEFTAKDGYKFNAYLVVGADFFFPST